MMAYIGTPPPLEYLRRSQVTSHLLDEKGTIPHSLFYTPPSPILSCPHLSNVFVRTRRETNLHSGKWKIAGGVRIPSQEVMSLEQAETVLEGEEKKRFLSFVRSMLKWVPEERPSAEELLRDPWLEGAIPG